MSRRRLLRRLVNALRPARAEPDLAREVAAHLALLEDEFVRRGMTAEEARFAAKRAFGGVALAKDLHRDARSFVWLDDLRREVQYAARTLRRTPGFTAVAVLTLALGIGANTAIFSLVNVLILRTLPVAEPQRLVTLSSGTGRPGADQWTTGTWEQIRLRAEHFEGAFAWAAARLRTQGSDAQPLDSIVASGDFFTTLGVRPWLGRAFTPADDARGGGPDGPVAVISYGLWQRRFGGAASVVGTRLIGEGVSFTIIGVTPPEFFGVEVGRTFDVVLPLGVEPMIRGRGTALDAPSTRWLRVLLRLKRGQSIDAGTRTLRDLQPEIREAAMPADFPQLRAQFLKEPFMLEPAAGGTSALRLRYGGALLTILAIVGLVLVIACGNIASLLLARTSARRHELSVRIALGAGRSRLARQLLVESLLLASLGAAAGLLVAWWASRALIGQLTSDYSSRIVLDLSLDWRVMAFTLAVAVASAILFGTAPAIRATGLAPVDALKDRSGHVHGEAGRGLLVAQVAVSLILVVAAGLLIRTFERLATMPLGFDRDRVLLATVGASPAVAPPNRGAFYQQIVNAAAAVPGVTHAAGSMMTPISGGAFVMRITISGSPPLADADRETLANFVTPDWFGAYGTALRAGRDFNERDAADAEPVAVVNEVFARRFLPHRPAVGATIVAALGPRGEVLVGSKTVVGVVGDAVYRSVREDAPPTLYLPMAQWPSQIGIPMLSVVYIALRPGAASPVSLAPSVAAALSGVDNRITVTFRPLAEQVNASFSQERLVAMLAGVFGALALLLSAVGLYGVTAYSVTRRRVEIGIRMALGARRRDVLRLVLSQSLATTAAGVFVGLAGAAAVTRYLEKMLFGVTPLDPPTFAAVAVIFLGVSVIAAFLPARRAASVDPLVALRCE